MRQTLHQFDKSITQRVASIFGPSALPFFRTVTMCGDPIAVSTVTIAMIGYGIVISNVGLMIAGGAIPATVLAGALLKLLFERARPLTEYAMNMKLQTFSFPSGHSSGSMITYGLLAYFAFMSAPFPLNTAVGAVLTLVPIAVGVSRVYLGAHFPSDVIAGWLLGLIGIFIVIYYVGPIV